jgi:alanyl-tRNA synthetase
VTEDGDTVTHTLGPDARTKKWAKGRELEGAIDSTRRLENTELHSAQHLLSAMLLRTLELRTVAFALGETSTLDVAAKEITPEQLASLESAVNAAIRACHPVTVSEHRGSALIPTSIRTPLTQEAMDDPHGVRIVAIGPEDAPIDRDPCDGTHVTSTGQLGTLLILSAEPGPEETTRVTFVVGRRAYDAMREKLGPIGEPAP